MVRLFPPELYLSTTASHVWGWAYFQLLHPLSNWQSCGRNFISCEHLVSHNVEGIVILQGHGEGPRGSSKKNSYRLAKVNGENRRVESFNAVQRPG